MVKEGGLREQLTREDGTSWTFGYNDRSEVTSGVKKLANGDLAAGLQFAYHYDGIGNRQWAKSGGNSSGENLRTTTYTPDALNQYAQIATPGSFDVLARSPDPVGVEVNGNIIAWTAPNDVTHDTLQRIDYDPFGNVVTRESAPGFEVPAWGFSIKNRDMGDQTSLQAKSCSIIVLN